MMDGDIEDLVLQTIERWMAGRYSERHGLVTSYDPKKYLAKVMIQPQMKETGWLPIETGHIGAGYGIAVGLQPGDGKTTGDQVIVRFQGNDFESGKIVQRVHSDQDTPPTVQSGEMVIWSRFQKSQGGPNSAQGAQGGNGQQLYFKNDGSFLLTDGNGASIIGDGNGNMTHNCKNFTLNTTQNATFTIGAARSVSVGANDNINIGQSKTVTIGNQRSDKVSNAYTIDSQIGVWSTLADQDG